jgi:NADH-quinone oxidoreductase subunit H
MTTVSALATTLFLGGWRAPWPLTIWSGANSGWWPMLWFVIKVLLLLFGYVWLRGSLPRVRYDQLMALGWKVLIPISIVWILMVATLRTWRNNEHNTVTFVIAGLIIVIVILLFFSYESAAQKRAMRYEVPEGESPPEPAFPVPPMDLPHYHGQGGLGGMKSPQPLGVAGDRSPADSRGVTGA